MTIRPKISNVLADEIESLRQGTRQQFESDWVLIPAPNSGETLTQDFTHELGEIPWLVDVTEAADENGLRAVELDSNSTITIAKDGTTITLSRTYSTDYPNDLYFKVRAM